MDVTRDVGAADPYRSAVSASVWNSLDTLTELPPAVLRAHLCGFDVRPADLRSLFDDWHEQQSPGQGNAVVVTGCNDYRLGPLEDALERILDRLILRDRIEVARTILIKVGLVEGRHPGWQATTQPTLLRALIAAIRSLSATARLVVADGSGHEKDSALLLRSCGLADVIADSEGVEYVDLNFDDLAVVNVTDPLTFSALALPVSIVEADLVISLAKLKTHHWTGVTLGMKNLFGALPGSVYGFPKNRLHWASLPRAIADIYATIRPGLTIVDGILGVEGDGPLRGRPKHVGALLASRSAFACDVTGARLMGFSHLLLPQFWFAAMKDRGGLAIDTVGDDIGKFATTFAAPPNMPWLYDSWDRPRERLFDDAQQLLVAAAHPAAGPGSS